MARVKKEEAIFNPIEDEKIEDAEINDEMEETDVVTDSASGITLSTKDKKFKVRLRSNHSCHIGGETYHFVKGEVYNVTADVKRVLANADLLSNL